MNPLLEFKIKTFKAQSQDQNESILKPIWIFKQRSANIEIKNLNWNFLFSRNVSTRHIRSQIDCRNKCFKYQIAWLMELIAIISAEIIFILSSLHSIQKFFEFVIRTLFFICAAQIVLEKMIKRIQNRFSTLAELASYFKYM